MTEHWTETQEGCDRRIVEPVLKYGGGSPLYVSSYMQSINSTLAKGGISRRLMTSWCQPLDLIACAGVDTE